MKRARMRLKNLVWSGTAAFFMLAGGSLLPAFVQPDSAQGVVFAQQGEKSDTDSGRKTRRTPALKEKTYKALAEAQTAFDASNYAGALEILNNLKADQGLNSYERAMTWNYIAYVYSGQEKYQQSINAFKQVLAQPEIPEALEQQTLYALAQLYLVTDNQKEAITVLKKWFTLTPNPSPDAYVLLAQAYFQLDDYKSAVAEAEKGLAATYKLGEQPKELLLQLLRAGYVELDNNPKLIDVLELLVKLYPKGDYFAHLSALYGERGDEVRQLLTLEAAYDGGYLDKQNQYVALASLLLSNDVPYKSAKVLTQGIDKKIVEESVNNLRLLAEAWRLAQEHQDAIKVLQKAAKKAEDGELYIRLGQSYAELDEWQNCINAMREGLKKGKLDRPDQANLTLGQCLFNDNDLDGAIAAFTRARTDERSRKFSDQWITFLKNEKDRRQRLANSLM
ncbi:MAG TPA: CDC27 family protein [Gammaproteobacteria bacterium]